MIEGYIKIVEQGGAIVTTFRALANETTTEREEKVLDELAELVAKQIADKGGDATFLKRIPRQ